MTVHRATNLSALLIFMHLTYFQAIVLGLLQGVSELFPISSLGHSVIARGLLGWSIDPPGTPPDKSFFLTFLVATHLATAIVLLGFFWKEWVRIVKGMGISLKEREIRKDNIPARVGWNVLIGTIPAGILGAVFEEPLRAAFKSSLLVASLFLIANGGLLYICEMLRRRAMAKPANADEDYRIAEMPWYKTVGVGAVQALALIPGFSRSGAAMGGSLLVGLNNEEAAKFAFFLATPIIAAAGLLNVPDFFKPENQALIGPSLVGAVCSGITAYLAVRFLMKYFERKNMIPFAIYCALLGILTSAIFILRR